MSKLVSIVLPVYNGEQYLRESIESILAQTYTNWELLIVDDCSSDSSPEIAKSYEIIDKRVHFFRNEHNLKLPRTLNRGFSLATGEYLTWTSDDNRFFPTALEKMVGELDFNPSIGFVFSDYQIINEKGIVVGEYQVPYNYTDQIVGTNVVGACFLYRREVYETVGDYQHEVLYVEDFDYWQRVFARFSTKCIHEFLYQYRVHGQSLSGTIKERVVNDRFERVIKSNAHLFSKMNTAQKYYYYYGLYRCAATKKCKKPVFGYWFYHSFYYYPNRAIKRIKRIIQHG